MSLARVTSVAVALAMLLVLGAAVPAEAAEPDSPIQARVQALVPAMEAYIADGMKAFDCPGMAVGIVADDSLVYGKGFGFRRKGVRRPISARCFRLARQRRPSSPRPSRSWSIGTSCTGMTGWLISIRTSR